MGALSTERPGPFLSRSGPQLPTEKETTTMSRMDSYRRWAGIKGCPPLLDSLTKPIAKACSHPCTFHPLHSFIHPLIHSFNRRSTSHSSIQFIAEHRRWTRYWGQTDFWSQVLAADSLPVGCVGNRTDSRSQGRVLVHLVYLSGPGLAQCLTHMRWSIYRGCQTNVYKWMLWSALLKQ